MKTCSRFREALAFANVSYPAIGSGGRNGDLMLKAGAREKLGSQAKKRRVVRWCMMGGKKDSNLR